MNRKSINLLIGLLFQVFLLSAHGQSNSVILRDRWGTAHVFAETDSEAFLLMGQAMAKDRGFQMYYHARIMQGRSSEILGEIALDKRNETSLSRDIKHRQFQYWRYAQKAVERLDEEARGLLEAFCEGINGEIQGHPEDRNPMFKKMGLEPEPWTPAHCILNWWHLAKFFGPDGTRDLIAEKNLSRSRPGFESIPTSVQTNDSAAIVKESEADPAWVEKVREFQSKWGYEAKDAGSEEESPKFSHAWVVGGTKTTTGSSVLVSDPQTPVRDPSLFYEVHLSGPGFNARGISVPGAPIFLIGFNQHVAWGMTAVGADQADLFQITTDKEKPGKYFVDGQWTDMEIHTETVRVLKGEDIEIEIASTILGPIITDYVFANPADGEFALRWIPYLTQNKPTLQAGLAMMQSKNLATFEEALSDWLFPSANCVAGDKNGGIGYWLIGALPHRSKESGSTGRFPHPGDSRRFDWQGRVPFELNPHTTRPPSGFLFSANHRPVDDFYRIPIGNTTGAHGHTVRSWRLQQLFEAHGPSTFEPADVLKFHFDKTNPAKFAIVKLAYEVFKQQPTRLSNAGMNAISYLGSWIQNGGPSDTDTIGGELAHLMSTPFRIVNSPLAASYGGGESGLVRALTDLLDQVREDPERPLSEDAVLWMDQILSEAWMEAHRLWGPEPGWWNDLVRTSNEKTRLGRFVGLDGLPSLDSGNDLELPFVKCRDGGTILSQMSQSYTQYVPMHDPDSALSLLPPGPSERVDSPYRSIHLKDWAAARLHPAPLSREAVEKILH